MRQYIEAFISPHGEIAFVDHLGFESRSESTMALFKEAFDQIKDKTTLKTKHFYISTDDVSSKINNTLTFGYTNSNDVILCPDFTFDKWLECGIVAYNKTIKKIIDEGNNKYTVEKLFWIGNLNTQPLRYELLRLGNLFDNKMEIVPMEWKRIFHKGSMHDFTKFTSLENHTKYKYLIDCGARGFSGRLKFLLYTNRPLFLVNRDKNKQEYFYDKLVPFKHFIPVKEDLSDLIFQLEWAENNYADAIAIADNARKFAIENLSKKSVIEYLTNQWINYL
ncbi:glycosyl transferase family 90 [Flavobacterium daejeonense]|uniref:glycosyl transferase family 90 n=1 Tax=Flavobacterium daejeonense TaxID=350893 RepID=UPI00047E5912|nr:glycosyl transferase family 90 [Flavobacterium daejeonense]